MSSRTLTFNLPNGRHPVGFALGVELLMVAGWPLRYSVDDAKYLFVLRGSTPDRIWNVSPFREVGANAEWALDL